MMRRHKALLLLMCSCAQGCPQDRSECVKDSDCFAQERCDSTNQCLPSPQVETQACDLSACQSELTQEVGCFAGRCEVLTCKEGASLCTQGCCPTTEPTQAIDAFAYNPARARLTKRVYDEQGAPHLWSYDPETTDITEVSWDGVKWRAQIVTVYPSINVAFEITYDASGSKHLAYTAVDGALYYAKIDAQGAWTSERLLAPPGGDEVYLPNQIVVSSNEVVISFLTGTLAEIVNQVNNPDKPTLKIAHYSSISKDWTVETVPTAAQFSVNQQSSMLYTPEGIYIAATQLKGAEIVVSVYNYPLGGAPRWREMVARPGFIAHPGALTVKDRTLSLLYSEESVQDTYQLKIITAPTINAFSPLPRWGEVTLLTGVPDVYLLDTSLELPEDETSVEAVATLYHITTNTYEIIPLNQPPQDFAVRAVLRDKLRCRPALGYFERRLTVLSCDESSFTYLTQELGAP